MKKPLFGIILFLIFVLASCSKPEKHAYIKLTESSLKNSYYHYYDGGKTRSGIVYMPKITSQEKIPLVIVLHGAGQSGKDMETAISMNKRADMHNFIVAYPDAYMNNWDYKNIEIDDVKFLSDMIEKLTWKYNIDKKRVYLVGFSDGGFMAYHLAASIPDKICAVAAVNSSAAIETIDKINSAMPVLHLHGMIDPIMPFDGIESRTGIIYPARKVLNKWIKVNNCNIKPVIEDNKNGVIKEHWISKNNNDVFLYRYLDGMHNWPKIPVAAEDLILNFFYQYPDNKKCLQLGGLKIGDVLKVNQKKNITAELETKQKIVKVEFFANKNKIAEDISAPFQCEWLPDKIDRYKISARAVLDDGSFLYSINSTDILVMPKDPNIAKNKKAYSSTNEHPKLVPGKAVDGKFATRWSSMPYDPQWIYIDLEKAQKISGVTLFWETAHALEYQLQVSMNANDWDTVYENKKSKGNIEFVELDSVTARYVRIYGIKRGTPWGYSLWEIMIHKKK